MAIFTVRVELHKATDYKELHEFMEEEGFKRIVNVAGTMRHLPTGEYSLNGLFTASQVLRKAKLAAAKTKKTFTVLVTESKERRNYNLAPA